MSRIGISIQFARASSNEAKARLTTTFSIQRIKGWSNKCQTRDLTPTNQTALRHFDRYYTHIYGASVWSGIRAALLAPSAKVAVLNSFNPTCDTVVDNLCQIKCRDIISDLRQSSVVPIEDMLSEEYDEPGKNVSADVSDENQSQFLVSEDVSASSEFVSPTEFISEHRFYSRGSDRAFSLHDGDSRTDSASSNSSMLIVNENDDAFLSNSRHLRCYGHPNGMLGNLGQPHFSHECYDFYPLDLGSVLAVLSLDIKPKTRMLDLCAAPGGKSIVALQTLNIADLVCADNSPPRLERLKSVLSSFGPGVGSGRSGLPDVCVTPVSSLRLLLQRASRGAIVSEELFDRVLVDVPCSTDRTALTTAKGSFFSRGKAKDRLQLPAIQQSLLWQAMNICRLGGNVVYSTCTLSTAQNQGVVEACLARLSCTETGGKKLRFAVVDPSPLLHRLSSSFTGLHAVPAFASTLLDKSLLSNDQHHLPEPPIGIQVVPRLSANYGPSFICKLKRIE